MVAEAFHAADVEATLAVADAGVGRERDVADARVGVRGRRVRVDDGAEAADARAGDGQVDVVGALIGGREGGAVDVVGRARGDFDGVTAAEGGVGAEAERAGLDLRAAREAVHAGEHQHARTRLDEADGAADAFLDVGGEGVGIGREAAEADGDDGGRRARVDDDAAGGGAADAAAGEAEAVQVERAAGDHELARVGAERGGRRGGVGQEAEGAAVDDCLARVGVGAREGQDPHAGLLDVAFADDLVGEGDVVDAVDRQGGASSDGDVALDRADRGAITQLQGTAFDEGRAREGLGERVDEAGSAGVGASAGDAVDTGADLAEDQLAGAAVGVVDERAAELVGDVVAADRQDGRRARGVVEDGTDDVRGGGDGAGEGLVAAVHVQVAAIKVDVGVVVDLVVARTREADRRARVDGTVVAEGVDARGRLRRQDQGAGVDHHPEVGVVEGTAEGERASAVLGEDEGTRAGDAVEVDVAGAADGEAVRRLREGPGHVRRGGRVAVDERALAVDAETGDVGEGLGDGLAVEVQRGARVDRRGAGGGTERARVRQTQDVTRVDRGGAGEVVEAGQDDRTEGTGGADVQGVGAGEDGVDGQRRAAATEAVALGARREGSRQRVEGGRRDGADHQRRVEAEGDRVGGVAGQGQRTSGSDGQLVGGDPGRNAGVGTGGDEGTRRVQADGRRGRGAGRGDLEDARADGGRAGVGIGAGEDHAAIEALVGDRTGARGEVADEEVRRDGVHVSEH